MNGFSLALIIVGVLSVIEAILGIAKRSRALIVIGLLFALVCALALIISLRYSGAEYIEGSSYIARI